MNQVLGFTLWGLLCFFLGAFTHENDMANNCERYGNAAAWFNEIKCEQSE